MTTRIDEHYCSLHVLADAALLIEQFLCVCQALNAIVIDVLGEADSALGADSMGTLCGSHNLARDTGAATEPTAHPVP